MEFLLPVAAETLITYLIGVKIMNGFKPVEELELTDDFIEKSKKYLEKMLMSGMILIRKGKYRL